MNPSQLNAQPAPAHPPTYEVTLTPQELDGVCQLIATQAYNVAAPLLQKIDLQVRLQLQRAEQKIAAGGVRAEEKAALFSADLLRAESYADALERLRGAEQNRRSGDGTLDVTPGADDAVDDDYAASTTLISTAMGHLDESLPNGQRRRTLSAFAALEYGTRALGAWLGQRAK